MTLDDALIEFNKYAFDFISVGDAKKFIIQDKNNFLNKWAKVVQYYNYIIKNANNNLEILNKVQQIIDNMIFCNPSLDMFLENINQNKSQSNNIEIFEPYSFAEKISSLISEMRNIKSWDLNMIYDAKWELKKYQKTLMTNYTSFEISLYSSLLKEINSGLEKIDNTFNDKNSSLKM